MKFCLENIKTKFNSTCIASTILMLISFISLIHVCVTIFIDDDQGSPTDVAIRSVMSSIFGYIFGAQLTENSNIPNKKFQVIIASLVAIICLVISILIHWLNANQISPSAVEIRNLLFSSVGFLLSRAKRTI